MICPECRGEYVEIIPARFCRRINPGGILSIFGQILLTICTCGIWLFIYRSKNGKLHKLFAVCQDCNYMWEVK